MKRIVLAVALSTSVALAGCDAGPTASALLEQPLMMNDYGFANLAAGDNDDWSDGACFWASGICHVVGHASGSTITGLSKSVFGDKGVVVWILNRGQTTIVVANDDAGSSLNNRIHTRSGGDVLIPPGEDHAFVAVVDWTTSPATDEGWNDLGMNAVREVQTSTPSRSLGAAFQPSPDRAVRVTYSAHVDCEISLSGGEEGRVELVSDSANPPTTVRAILARCRATGTAVLGLALTVGSAGSASYDVPPGDRVLLRSVTVTGTPAFGLDAQVEQL